MVMKNFLLGLSKFVLGIILAMLVVSLAGLSMARYFMTRLAEPPERPTYDNDLPETPPDAAEPPADSPAATETPETEADETLAEGAYRAVVTQPVGLIVRAGPGPDYEQIGGLEYQASVVILSEDSGWLEVQLSGGQEGWIKEGNVAEE
ncbi:SH3 domain-containing protein [Leptolyngbya sp. BC1307]|uniref:SH3 domain-containing protein n=1 Tax=Leptolyngbya sp. BC1307 TaxID=2029589 RepID=UPI000EFC9D90|nr:SH3 domain-containing protein [Leptolyngbya sp. BC1307]